MSSMAIDSDTMEIDPSSPSPPPNTPLIGSDSKTPLSPTYASPPPDLSFKFRKFPIQVRNKVYALLLVSDAPILTTSPRTRRNCREKPRIFTTDRAIMFVNKQLYKEARVIFYEQNLFVLGTGRYGCTYEPNIHGLHTFVSCVPQNTIAKIKEVQLRIYVPPGWLNTTRAGPERDFVERKIQSDIELLGKVLSVKFNAVERVKIEFELVGGLLGAVPEWGRRAWLEVTKQDKMESLWRLVQMDNLKSVTVKQELWAASAASEFLTMLRFDGRFEEVGDAF